MIFFRGKQIRSIPAGTNLPLISNLIAVFLLLPILVIQEPATIAFGRPFQRMAASQPSSATAAQSNSTTASQAAPGAFYDWLQFNGDPQHSGNNTAEGWIGISNASRLSRLFQVSLPGVVDGAPVLLHGVSTPTGVKDLLFATTKDGRILALDAQTGALVWAHQYGPGTCKINNGASPCYTTSSPVIDPAKTYVYSYGLDGYVHKYQVGDGAEIKTGGWPELATLKGFNEKGSSALSLATAQNGTSYLYVTNGGYPGDRGDYQGHVTAINLADGSQQVFNTLCSNQTVHFVETPGTPDCPDVQSAVWARAGVIYDPALDKIFIGTGNGSFDPAGHAWGDSILALQPNGSGANGGPLDSYTPTDYQSLQNADADLGSTAPAILPTLPGSKFPHLAVQSGKDYRLRLLNLDNLSGQGGPGHTGGEVGPVISLPHGDAVLSQPAVWTNPFDGRVWVFVSCSTGISAYRLAVDANGNPSLALQWTAAPGGTSPLVANGVLYYASYSGIRALDPLTGSLLWSDPSVSSFHWQSPVVANGILYIADQTGRMTAYSTGGIIPIPFSHFDYLPAVGK
ncbi:MAG: PQQ-binding-like beta-propeller repeat protein [Chloroflexi bacterium]|nr:PQQ-binding-like beta-propeller repeat protein [Chloroflexota bacterium]